MSGSVLMSFMWKGTEKGEATKQLPMNHSHEFTVFIACTSSSSSSSSSQPTPQATPLFGYPNMVEVGVAWKIQAHPVQATQAQECHPKGPCHSKRLSDTFRDHFVQLTCIQYSFFPPKRVSDRLRSLYRSGMMRWVQC